MKITVTRKHINKGRKGDAVSCPVALALREKFNLAKDLVVVDETTARISDEGNEEYYFIRRGQRFIQRFDKGLSVKPCTVELVPV